MINISYLITLFVLEYKLWVVLFLLLTHVALALYLKYNGYTKWWLGFIPVASNFAKAESAGVGYVIPIIGTTLFALGFLTTFWVAYVVYVGTLLCINFKFYYMNMDNYPTALLTLVPLAGTTLMIKEVITNERA